MGGLPLILLDTHALIWLDAGSERLGAQALGEIDRALSSETLAVSAISFWEIGTLIRKSRLSLGIDIDTWRRDLLRAGLNEIAVGGDIAAKAAALEDFHGDPADRIIVASALRAGSTLCTADTRILDWPGGVLRQDAAL